VQEVIRLHDAVVELDEVEPGALEAGLVRLRREHLIDREVPPDVPQEGDVTEVQQPVGVVHEERRRVVAEAATVEVDVLAELRQDGNEVVADALLRHHLAGGRLAGGITNQCRATAAERDRAMTESLQDGEHHHPEHVPGVERRRGRVEALIRGDGRRGERFAQGRLIGDVLHIAASHQVIERAEPCLPELLRRIAAVRRQRHLCVLACFPG